MRTGRSWRNTSRITRSREQVPKSEVSPFESFADNLTRKLFTFSFQHLFVILRQTKSWGTSARPTSLCKETESISPTLSDQGDSQ